MTSNTYLIKALRGYREVTLGQFDQVSERVVQETQDAADEIERLNAEIERLREPIISIDGKPRTANDMYGHMSMRPWKDVAGLLIKGERDNWKILALRWTSRGIDILWGTP